VLHGEKRQSRRMQWFQPLMPHTPRG
jgi:hypothetical protein